jgi:SAM-dependent methyltransferase
VAVGALYTPVLRGAFQANAAARTRERLDPQAVLVRYKTPTILPLVFGLLASFGCGTIPGQDVRYEPTPMPVVRALLELAEVGPQDVVYDLGSGDGRIPITAAKEFGARGVGIEIDPALVAQAQANARDAGVADKVEFRSGDMYAAGVQPATVVTLFLHPGPNLKLREKLRSELQAGSRVVSYVWDMGGWKPTDVRRVGDHEIFLWRIPTGGR